MKRSRIPLVVILVAISALATALWANAGGLWRLVTTKVMTSEYNLNLMEEMSYYISSHQVRTPASGAGRTFKVRVYSRLKRFSEPPVTHGTNTSYYLASGRKAVELQADNGVLQRMTIWDIDGRVYAQMRQIGPTKSLFAPPWWWGVTDQTEPTAPWWGKE